MRAAILNKLEATGAIRALEGKEKTEEGNLFTDIAWSALESVITEDMYAYVCETWGYCLDDLPDAIDDTVDETIGNASKAILSSLYSWVTGSGDESTL